VGVPLETLEAMLAELGHPDEHYVKDLMAGTIAVGAIRRDGILEERPVSSAPGGEPSPEMREAESKLLDEAMASRNAMAIGSLPDPTEACDPTAGTLSELEKKYIKHNGFYEWVAGRLVPAAACLNGVFVPAPAAPWEFDRYLLTPRFVFLQERADGSSKERMVDNGKFSGLNTLLEVAMKMRYDSRRDLERCRKALLAVGRTPRYVTHDVTAAYKYLAHSPGMLHLTPIAVRVMCSHGKEAPEPRTLVFIPERAIFGGVYSVHSWHRTGGALQAIAQRGLLIPMLRYVDDLFRVATDESLHSDRETFEVIAAALGYRLAKSNLEGFEGDAAIDAGRKAEVLGGALEIDGEEGFEQAAKAGVYAAMCRRVAARIREGGEEALRDPTVRLLLKQVAGRNEWAAYAIYGRPAKAMNRHVYKAANSRGPKGTAVAKLPPAGIADVLDWYASEVYSGPPVRVGKDDGRHAVVFSDACTSGAGIGAVVFDPVSGKCWWWSGSAPAAFRQRIPKRHRIHYLELYAAVAAVDGVLNGQDAPPELAGVDSVLLFTDNSSAMWNLVNGYSSRPVANALLFDFYQALHRKGVRLHVEHVPGRFNPADDPSRLLTHRLGRKRAEFREFLAREYGDELPCPEPAWLEGCLGRMDEWSRPVPKRPDPDAAERPAKRERREGDATVH